jgi:hypothetical protein
MEGSKLSDEWKVPSLVANGRFQCLVAFGRKRISIIFTSFHFPPQQILLKPFFIDFKVLFYHGSKPLLYIFPSFSLTYKL